MVTLSSRNEGRATPLIRNLSERDGGGFTRRKRKLASAFLLCRGFLIANKKLNILQFVLSEEFRLNLLSPRAMEIYN